MSQVPFPGQIYPGDPGMQQPVYPYPPAQQPPVTQQIPPAMATSFGGHAQVPPQPVQAVPREMTPVDTLMKVLLPRLIEKSKAHEELFNKLSKDIAALHMRLETLQVAPPDLMALTQEVAALKEQLASLTAATAKKPRAPRKKKVEDTEPVEPVEENVPMYTGADGNMYPNRELAPGLRLYPDESYPQNPLLVDGQPIDAAFIRKVKDFYDKSKGLHDIEAMADIYDLNEAALKFYHTLPQMTVERILSLGG